MTIDEAKVYHSIREASMTDQMPPGWKIIQKSPSLVYFETIFLGFTIRCHPEYIYLEKNDLNLRIDLTKEILEKENLFDFLVETLIEKPRQNKLIDQFLEEYDRWKSR